MSKAKFSAVVLTKNAEDTIRDCLDSIKWADEIVIVDGYSTDGTLGICRNYTDKIIQSEFKGFADERNIGIDNSTGVWILQLDADEVVTSELSKAINEVLEWPGPYVGYKFRRKNYFLEHPMRHGGWYHYSAHFFKRGYARYEGLVHERLILNGKQGTLEAGIEHRPFKSIAQFIERQNRYTDLEAKDILSERGLLANGIIGYNLYIKPLKLFWKFYVKKQGFREGMYGFIFSVLFSFVHFLKWAKYWELAKEKIEK